MRVPSPSDRSSPARAWTACSDATARRRLPQAGHLVQRPSAGRSYTTSADSTRGRHQWFLWLSPPIRVTPDRAFQGTAPAHRDPRLTERPGRKETFDRAVAPFGRCLSPPDDVPSPHEAAGRAPSSLPERRFHQDLLRDVRALGDRARRPWLSAVFLLRLRLRGFHRGRGAGGFGAGFPPSIRARPGGLGTGERLQFLTLCLLRLSWSSPGSLIRPAVPSTGRAAGTGPRPRCR